MKTLPAALLALALATGLAGPAHAAGADGFTLVNNAGAALANVQIRRSGGGSWKALGISPAAGQRAAVAFSDPDCAFDLKADVGGKSVTWSGVNLCEVDAVILNLRGSTGWADYQ